MGRLGGVADMRRMSSIERRGRSSSDPALRRFGYVSQRCRSSIRTRRTDGDGVVGGLLRRPAGLRRAAALHTARTRCGIYGSEGYVNAGLMGWLCGIYGSKLPLTR